MRHIGHIIIIISGFLLLSVLAGNTHIVAPQMSPVHPLTAHIPHGSRIFAGETAFFRNKIGKNLSPEQIFSMLNPKSYLNALSSLQNTLIKEKQMRENERMPLDSHERVIAFLIKSLDYLKEQGTIGSEDYTQFKRVLPGYYLALKQQEVRHEERLNDQNTPHNTTRYSSPLSIALLPPTVELANKNGILESISMGFKMTFGIQTAYAVVDCFNDRGPNPTIGPNLWAPCCDCTVNGYPVGCLNLICASWPNAIYDYATGICGCG